MVGGRHDDPHSLAGIRRDEQIARTRLAADVRQPAAEHRCHWRCNVGEPLQVPTVAVNVAPTLVAPATPGAATSAGARSSIARSAARSAGVTVRRYFVLTWIYRSA